MDPESLQLVPVLREHLRHPRQAGPPPAGSKVASGEAGNPACGDRLWVHLWPAGLGFGTSFQAQACSAVLAVASLGLEALAEAIREAPDAAAVQRAAVGLGLATRIEAAGGLPRTKQHALAVFERALAAALDQLVRGAAPG